MYTNFNVSGLVLSSIHCLNNVCICVCWNKCLINIFWSKTTINICDIMPLNPVDLHITSNHFVYYFHRVAFINSSMPSQENEVIWNSSFICIVISLQIHELYVYLYVIIDLLELQNRLRGVMVRASARSAEGRGFDPRSRHTKRR